MSAAERAVTPVLLFTVRRAGSATALVWAQLWVLGRTPGLAAAECARAVLASHLPLPPSPSPCPSPEYKLGKNIKIAMLYLEDDDAVVAETYIKKAAALLSGCKVRAGMEAAAA